MTTLTGRHLDDAPVGKFPCDYDDLRPGDYWFVTVREEHPDYPRRLNVRDHPEDQRWWGSGNDPRYAGNLTGFVLAVIDPIHRYGVLSIHTVRDNEDGTVSVLPGDGSSNSILIKHGDPDPDAWHGYIRNGVWTQA